MDEVDEHGLVLWPAAERNKQPILQEMQSVIASGDARVLLEIAAGTGQHAVHMASHFPNLTYYPSDYDPTHLRTLQQRVKLSALPNLKEPFPLDVTQEQWPLSRTDVVYNANMVHIAPWEVAEGLFRGAGRILEPGGLLVTYGPYKIAGSHTSESNQSFDRSLKARDARWGVRDLGELSELAERNGLVLREKRAMPANNFFVVWDRV